MLFYDQALQDPQITKRFNRITYAPGPIDELKAACSVSAFYALRWGFPVDGLGELLPKAPRFSLGEDEMGYSDTWRQVLSTDWGITNREEVLETTQALLDYPSDPMYVLLRPELQQLVNTPFPYRQAEAQRLQEVVVRKYNAMEEGELRGIFANWCKPFLYPESLETLPAVLPYNVVGWYTARAGWVLRMSLMSGLITEADAVPRMLRSLTVTRAWCSSWRELADSFLVGRAEWDGEPDADWFSYRDGMAFCLQSDAMPWAHIPLHP